MLSFSASKPLNSKVRQHLLLYASLYTPFIHEALNRLVTENNKIEKNVIKNLTSREKEVLLWTAEGKTSADISLILSISERTVIFHHQNLAKKLNVSSRAHAVAKAISLGILNPLF